MTTCLINQSACGRVAGSPVCLKCGMDERVVYPGQADREAAQERAELRYWKAHAKALEAKPVQLPPPPSTSTTAVGESFRDAPWAPAMVQLPQGRFLMGSPWNEPGRGENEGPQHQVTIAYGLVMGKYPVTFEEWDACVADGGTTYKPDDNGWGRGLRPVINVSWADVQDYILWLNLKLGLAPDSADRYRLPTESEWEYACRAGSTRWYATPDGLISGEVANYYATVTFDGAPKPGRFPGKTTPVGTYLANPWGLHDLHGNVSEWVQDGYEDSHVGAPTNGSAWGSGSRRRVMRGGSWCDIPQDLRCAARGSGAPVSRMNRNGFRLAMTVSPK